MIGRLILLCLAMVPLATWGMFKPIRVIAPQLNGVECFSNSKCLEDMANKDLAINLYDQSISAVEKTLEPLENRPRAIFCSTEKCFESFGLKEPSVAAAVGVSGVVVSPRGWKIEKLTHEFVHHLQAEKFGVFKMFSKPEWLIEGMAYYMSNDNMNDVPERYREAKRKFEKWYLQNNKYLSWEELREIKK